MRFNFSVRDGKRWNPHAVFTLMSLFRSLFRFTLERFPFFRSFTPDGRLFGFAALWRKRVHTGVADPCESVAQRASLSARLVFVSFLRNFRAISTARLSMSPCLHLRPIDVVVCDGPLRDLILKLASCLDAFSTYPTQTLLPGGAPGGTTGTQEVCPTRSSRTSVGSPQISTPTTDRDRTVSRRSEPSSRATLMGEQPNPWDLLQPRDVTSRHRGAKPLRRYELLGGISLLSPEYLLSFERRPFHAEPPDHYAQVSFLFDMSVSQSSALMPLHSATGCQSV